MISDTEKEPVLHDQVLVEAQIDESVVGFRAVVVNVQPGAIWLGLARPDPLLERLIADQPVQLTFRRDSAAIVASSAFKSHLGSGKARLFAVHRPSTLQMVQRRAHLRLEIERPVEIRVVNQGASGPAGREGNGKTRNICAGGVQFTTDMPLAVGDELELTIVLEAGDAVAAEAVVVRIDRHDEVACPDAASSKPERSCAAVRFLSISEVGQDKIVRHIFSVQRQRREDAARKPA